MDTDGITGSLRRLLQEFDTLGIRYEIIDPKLRLIRYKTKRGAWKKLKGIVSEDVPLFSKMIADDKWWTHKFFTDQKIPTPRTICLKTYEEAAAFLKTERAVAIKPRRGAHGHGVTVGITAESRLKQSLQFKKAASDLLMQQHVEGRDIRILTVGNKVVSAMERRPAYVRGDGKHTVAELIHEENQRQERGKPGIDALVEIPSDAALDYLGKKKMQMILKDNQSLRVIGPSNHSLGGSVHDAMHLLSPDIKDQAIRISHQLKLPIAGIDCFLQSDGHLFLEINANPGIGIHDDNLAGVTSGCFEAYSMLLYNS